MRLGAPPKVQLTPQGVLMLDRASVKELKRCVSELADHDFLGGVAIYWLDERDAPQAKAKATFRIEPRLMTEQSGVWPTDSLRVRVSGGEAFVLGSKIGSRRKHRPFPWVEAVPKSGGLEVTLNGAFSNGAQEKEANERHR